MDGFDLRILSALQENGRLTSQELAEKVGLSPSQCARRRQQLEVDGVIAGYRAVFDAERLGFGLTAIVDVVLNTHNADNSRHFAELVNRLPQIREAYALTGEMDYQLKLVVRDLKELNQLINETLVTDRSVQTVKSAIVLARMKDKGGLPI